MALTQSTMLPLGSSAPDFSLTDTSGEIVSKSDFADCPMLVMFICNHCPYVKHVAPTLSQLGKKYADSPLAMVAIQSNDVQQYPDDSLEKMEQESLIREYTFPYLLDETQEVAKAYAAACTPDFYLFDRSHQLVYRGRIDASMPTRIRSGVYDSTENPATGDEVRAAIEKLLSGEVPASEGQAPASGCNIKWKPGNEPDYFG